MGNMPTEIAKWETVIKSGTWFCNRRSRKNEII